MDLVLIAKWIILQVFQRNKNYGPFLCYYFLNVSLCKKVLSVVSHSHVGKLQLTLTPEFNLCVE